MSMTNNTALQPPNTAQIAHMFATAQSTIRSVKTGAILGTGEMALIEQAARLHPSTRIDIEQRIIARNDQITHHNDQLGANAPKAERKLPIKAPDKDKMAVHEYWRAMRRAIIRLVGEYDLAKEQSHVSRYDAVLKFVFEHVFKNTHIQAAQDVVNAINGVGGFEQAIGRGRGSGTSLLKFQAAVDRKVRDDLDATLRNAAPLGTVIAKGGADGTVVIIAQRSGKQMTMLVETPLDMKKDAARFRPFVAGLFAPEDARCELIKRLADLATLVPEGAETRHFEGNNHGGVRIKVSRVLVLRPTASEWAEVLISALPTRASLIIRATPRGDALLTAPTEDLVLGKPSLEALSKRYAVRDAYRFETLTEGLPNWTLTSSAAKAGEEGHELGLDWEPIGAHAPLEVHGFADDAKASVDAVHLGGLVTDCLKGGAAGDRTVSVSAVADSLRFELNPGAAWECAATIARPKAFMGHFRLPDIEVVVERLIGLGVSTVDITADASGPLRFAWEDALARYEVYVPQVMEENALDPAKLRPIPAQG